MKLWLTVAALVGVIAALTVGGVSLESTKQAADAKLSGIAHADYKVDVVFDTAKGIRPGQLVKIAGARAGTVTKVKLTPDYKARIEMLVDRRFKPFRADARCAIKPEGLIGERFIQCDPGTPRARPLAEAGGHPTVPVDRTTLPVDFTDLFRIFNAPAQERLSVVVATLGLGTAGRGDDINAILRRANPALASTRRVLRVIDGQREQLRSAISDGDTVLAELARRRGRVREFITRAARVTGQTADHRTALAAAIRDLPGMLRQAQPALERVHEVATEVSPVLDDLQTAAPQLRALIDRVQPFATAATPVVDDLGKVLPGARTDVRTSTPAVRQLRRFASAALPTGTSLGELTENLRQNGFIEDLMRLTYRLGASNGRFDSVSHLGPVQLLVQAGGGCLPYAETPTPACDARYHPVKAGARERSHPQRHRTRSDRRPQRTAQAPAPAPASAAPQTSGGLVPKPPSLTLPGVRVPQLPQQAPAAPAAPTDDARNLLDYLLK